jgi:hypothetical protein
MNSRPSIVSNVQRRSCRPHSASERKADQYRTAESPPSEVHRVAGRPLNSSTSPEELEYLASLDPAQARASFDRWANTIIFVAGLIPGFAPVAAVVKMLQAEIDSNGFIETIQSWLKVIDGLIPA